MDGNSSWRTRAALMAAVALALPAAAAAGPVRFRITDLGSLGGEPPGPLAINDRGQIAGTLRRVDGSFGAFRTSPNALINPATDDLGTVGGRDAFAIDINNRGQVVGTFETADDKVRAFRTSPNAPINPATDDLGTLGGNNSRVNAINDQGQVVGSSENADGFFEAFRTSPDAPINPATDELGTLGGGFGLSSPTAINNRGQVVGTSGTADGFSHAFRTAPNAPIDPASDDLGTLGGEFSLAWDVNDLGQVVGQSVTADGLLGAFRTSPNAPINPATDSLNPDPNSSISPQEATAINDLGQVVGKAFRQHEILPFLYEGDGPILDLNELIPPDSGWALFTADDINNRGQIVGLGSSPDGQLRAFLLTPLDGDGGPGGNPIPLPPAVWAGLGTMFTSVVARRLFRPATA